MQELDHARVEERDVRQFFLSHYSEQWRLEEGSGAEKRTAILCLK